MFNRIVTQLISGKFICKVSFHDGHTYLSDADNFAKVDAYLRQIDLRLAKTGSEMAFFVTHADLVPRPGDAYCSRRQRHLAR
jgi:hypothetical protein